MRHYTSHVCPQKLHSCILLVRVSRFVFDQPFANVGSIDPALALETTNGHLLKELQELSLIDDVHELC